MNMPIRTPLLDPDDLLRLPDGDHYELIDGVPVEKAMGAESDEVSATLMGLLVPFVRANRLGRVYGSQTGFQCFAGRPKLVRLPDVSFVAHGRLPDDKSPKWYIKVAPDLAVEAVSHKDTFDEVWAKLLDYKAAGVRLVWVVSPVTRTVLIRRADGTMSELDDSGELSGEDVVPGFACKVADLFV